MTTDNAVDTLDGTYEVDPGRTVVRFRAKAFGLMWVRGSIPVVGGELTVRGGRLHGTGRLAADRVDTGLGARDRHLRHPHYLDTRERPRIEVSAEGDLESARVAGEVLVRGTPGRFVLSVRSVDADEDGLRIEAETTLDRTPFPMLPPAAGVSRRIEVQVALVARRAGPR